MAFENDFLRATAELTGEAAVRDIQTLGVELLRGGPRESAQLLDELGALVHGYQLIAANRFLNEAKTNN